MAPFLLRHSLVRNHINGGGEVISGVPNTVFVAPEAKILGGKVEGHARIEGQAQVTGGRVYGKAVIRDNAKVSGGVVFGNAIVQDNAEVCGGAEVYENAVIADEARVHGKVYGKAHVSGKAEISEGAEVFGKAQVTDLVKVRGGSRVSGHVKLREQVEVDRSVMTGRLNVKGTLRIKQQIISHVGEMIAVQLAGDADQQ
jgi:NDP-sugar pyrophosphorylase family protein